MVNQINHGLSNVPSCLPSNINIVLTFHRAPASFALLKLSDKLRVKRKDDDVEEDIPIEFPDNVVTLKSPVLNAFFAYSPTLEARMNKSSVYDYKIDYIDSQARRIILDSGVSDYQFTLQLGKFPKYLMLALTTLDRLGGSFDQSLTKFTQRGLKFIDVLVDQESLIGYPLTGLNNGAIEFYQEFLQSTNRYVIRYYFRYKILTIF